MLALFLQGVGTCFCLFAFASITIQAGHRVGRFVARVEEIHRILNDLVEVFTDEFLLKRLPPAETEEQRWRMEAELELSAIRAELGANGCGDPDCERCYR